MRKVPEPFRVGTLDRRPSFGDNPVVGRRGAQTQERILEAALLLFEEVGYHHCAVERITEQAECSRPAFYQYFSSKEDLFRRLAGDLSHRLIELAGAPERITPDEAGWQAIRSFVAAYADVHQAYSPVFAVFSTAASNDQQVATGAARVLRRQATSLLARFDGAAPEHATHEVALVLLNAVMRTQRYGQVLEREGLADLERRRVDDALADVVHRSLFGRLVGVNVRDHVPMAKQRTQPASGTSHPASSAPPGEEGQRTRQRLIEAAHDVFAERGFYGVGVEDVVELAETSRGTFYRYFENTESLFRIVAARAGRRLLAIVDELPADGRPAQDGPSRRDLRRWLTDYFEIYREEGRIVRAWVEAQRADDELRVASAQAVEDLRRRLAQHLAGRGFGDVDADGLVLMAMLDRSEPVLDAGAAEDAIAEAFLQVLTRALLPAG